MPDHRVPLPVKVDPAVLAALDVAAADQTRTRTQQVEHYLRRGLEAEGYMKPRGRAKPSSE